MSLGEWLLLGALALAGAAAGSAAYQLRTGSAAAERRAVLLGLAAATLAGLSFLALVGHFVARDYATYVVWNYSDEATPWWLRITGAWAGAAGSMLLWAALTGACLAAEEAWRRRAARTGDAPQGAMPAAARLAVLGVFAGLLLLALLARPFAPTADFHFDAATGFFTYQPGLRGLPDPLDFRAEGFGLNPLLITPFMAIHPPMEFLAYAASAMPFAFAVAGLATRDPKWAGGALQWARWAWLFYAIALGLGALWAYYVLSFGGAWAWDPVEVGDLLPFLGLTALLHAMDMHRKGKGYPFYTPFLAALTLPLTLFGTFVTRSSYWISAHAFDVGMAGIIADPALRLVEVAAAKPQTAMVLGFLLATLAIVGALFLARLALGPGKARPALGAPAWVLLAAYLLLALLAILDVVGLLRLGFGLAGLLGAGNVLLGLAVLGLVLLALPVALMVLSLGDDEEPKPLDAKALIQPDALMSAGVILLSLALLVTGAILLLGVNAPVRELRAVYEARMPLVLVPLTLVLTMRLTAKTIGPERAALLALGSAALGGLLWLLLPEGLRLMGLGVPILGVALGAGVAQVLKAAAKGTAAPREARTAGAFLILAGLAGFAMWASPPTALALAGRAVSVPLAYVPVGLGAAMASVVLGVALTQGEGKRVAIPGGLAAILAVGYGLGALLGLAALALAHRARAGLHEQRTLPGSVRHVKGRLYGTGRWMAHVGILLLFAGYGASAYHSVEADYEDLANPLERGVPRAFEGYVLTLVDSRGVDADRDGAFEQVEALVAVERGGVLLDVAPLRFTWIPKESQYRASEHVVRGPLEDLYLNSDTANVPSVHTARDGWVTSSQRALFDQQGDGQMRSDAVDQLALSVKRLPLVAPMWAGAALLPFSMALTIAAAPPRAFAKPAKGSKAEAEAKAAA